MPSLEEAATPWSTGETPISLTCPETSSTAFWVSSKESVVSFFADSLFSFRCSQKAQIPTLDNRARRVYMSDPNDFESKK